MEYHFEADVHTHTIASGHAYGTIREMAQAASGKGLKLLGITEHGPGIPGTCNPFYYTNLKVIPRVLFGVNLIHGCEINVLEGGKLSLDDFFLQYLDYAIAGIHMQCYQDCGIDQNTDNVIRCMQHPKVKLIVHPDDNHTPLDYEKLVSGAARYHVALEVNNSSLVKKDRRLGCVENYKTMLKLCEEMRVPILVDSDAHDPSWVGELSLAAGLLKEVHFDPDLVLNLNAERTRNFLTRPKQ